MTGGFAMLAFPAEYGNSGVMSFLVGPDGIVYQADLGDDTKKVAEALAAYDPNRDWAAGQVGCRRTAPDHARRTPPNI